jgi:hypothetical protein
MANDKVRMSPDPSGFVSTLEKICTEVAGPDAASVDRQSVFPERGVIVCASYSQLDVARMILFREGTHAI